MTETSEILSKLIKNQKNDISLDRKLVFTDLTRISNNLPNDIFSNECCIWNGYITNLKSNKKKCYISFFNCLSVVCLFSIRTDKIKVISSTGYFI